MDNAHAKYVRLDDENFHTAYQPYQPYQSSNDIYLQNYPSHPYGAYPATAQVTLAQSLGQPAEKPLWTWVDFVPLSFNVIGAIVGAVIVYNKPTAVSVGQTNQLILVGLILSTMAYATQREILRAALLLQIVWGSSSLQNLEAILTRDILRHRADWTIRTMLAFLLALPLVLGIVYKRLLLGGMYKLSLTRLLG